jgi:hypothetical protein
MRWEDKSLLWTLEMKRKDVPGIGIRWIEYEGGQNGNVGRPAEVRHGNAKRK